MAAPFKTIRFTKHIPPYIAKAAARRFAATRFLDFCIYTTPYLIIEETQALITDTLDQVVMGNLDRVMIWMSPRSGKSLFSSILFPAYYIGHRSSYKIMALSHSADLATTFGRSVRDLISSKEYQDIFPDIFLKPDDKAAGRWSVLHDNTDDPPGQYNAAGAGTGLAGKGFNLGLIDDPVSEQNAFNEQAQRRIIEWFPAGFYTRRQPECNQIVLMATRWSTNDLPGYLIKQGQQGGDKYFILDVPAELDERSAKRLTKYSPRLTATENARLGSEELNRSKSITAQIPSNKLRHPVKFKPHDSYAPRRWPREELERTKAIMPPQHWQALYMQSPTVHEGSIIKRSWWQCYPSPEPPRCEWIFSCLDTAFNAETPEQQADPDYSAMTTWGLFRRPDGQLAMVLLAWWRDRVEYPELRSTVKEHYIRFEPDLILVEKRASGQSLIQELKRTGLPVKDWLPNKETPSRKGRSKIARAHAATILFTAGLVWYLDRKWAHRVIDIVSAFPFGEEDDTVDTVTMATSYLRSRMMVDLPDDYDSGVDDDDAAVQQPVTKAMLRLQGMVDVY